MVHRFSWALLFTFSIESRHFVDYIKGNLENVMIKKEFSDKLNLIDKKDALQRILKPSPDQYDCFSNMKNYFDETITKAMSLFDYNYKTNLHITLNAKLDTQKNLTLLDELISYRLYKGKTGYNPIQVGFEKDTSELLEAEYILPDGKSTKVKTEEFAKEEKIEESGFKWNLFKFGLPKCISCDYVTVRVRSIEYGKDYFRQDIRHLKNNHFFSGRVIHNRYINLQRSIDD